jgi:hypothetical protein
MRTLGDSCVSCKFEEEAKHLLRRSSTKNFADYWEKKTRDNKAVSFDDTDKMNKQDKNKAFVRFIINHVAETIIKKNSRDYKTAINKFFNIILDTNSKSVVEEEEMILVKTTYESLKEDVDDVQKTIYLIQCAIKVISRPFLSYNFNFKREVYKLLICMAEAIISNKIIDNDYKEIIKRVKNILAHKNIKSDSILTFLKDFLFEALSDMKSNYLLREYVIKNIYLYILSDKFKDEDEAQIMEFWNKYAFLIHYIIDSGGDETHSLWMEHLFSYGTEYSPNQNDDTQPQCGKSFPLFDTIVSFGRASTDKPASKKEEIFKRFYMEIFLQNTRLIFDGIEKSPKEQGTQSNTNYFLQTFTKFREWDFRWAGIKQKDNDLETEKGLFNLIKNKKNKKDALKKYEKLLLQIKDTINEKYDIESDTTRLAIIVQNKPSKIDMDYLDFISDDFGKNPPHSPPDAKYIIKRRIILASETETKNKYKQNSNCCMHGSLEKNGYVVITTKDENVCETPDKDENVCETPDKDENICETPDKDENICETPDKFDQEADNNSFRKPFVIIRFEKKLIQNVYLYISFDFKSVSSKGNVVPFLILRDILAYRNRIITMLEADFISHLMQTHAKTASENAILRHEKAGSHTSTSDDQLSALIWSKPEKGDKFDKHDSFDKYAWLLFRNYTNREIAKIFNQTLLYRENEQKDNPKQRLYLKEEDVDNTDSFSQKADKFGDIWDENDKRVKMCKAFTEISDITDVKDSLIRSGRHGFFVKEYLKCILFDIILTGAKYWHENVDFLPRIEKLIKVKEIFSELHSKYDINNSNSNKIQEDTIKSYGRSMYRVLFMREDRNLIIINPVNRVHNNILNTHEQQNEKIHRRLTDPLDCFDGHMSMLAISNYLKHNSDKNTDENKWFEYKLFSELNESHQNKLKTLFGDYFDEAELWFVSTLPLFDS